jgi:hypothetical protein
MDRPADHDVTKKGKPTKTAGRRRPSINSQLEAHQDLKLESTPKDSLLVYNASKEEEGRR